MSGRIATVIGGLTYSYPFSHALMTSHFGIERTNFGIFVGDNRRCSGSIRSHFYIAKNRVFFAERNFLLYTTSVGSFYFIFNWSAAICVWWYSFCFSDISRGIPTITYYIAGSRRISGVGFLPIIHPACLNRGCICQP